MPIVYSYHAKDHTVRTKVTGCLYVESVCEYLGDLITDPNVPDGFLEIVDFDEVTKFGFEHHNIRKILAAYKAMKRGTKAIGTIFVATNPVAYGLCRVQMGFYDGSGVMEVVRSHENLEPTIERIRALYY